MEYMGTGAKRRMAGSLASGTMPWLTSFCSSVEALPETLTEIWHPLLSCSFGVIDEIFVIAVMPVSN